MSQERDSWGEKRGASSASSVEGRHPCGEGRWGEGRREDCPRCVQAGASLTPGAETITIALTGRGPVRVRRDLWPIEAHASGRSSVCYHTPIPKDETDGYYLTVRRHADGRAIVYARIDAASAWTGTEDRAEGEMLAATEDVAAAIQRVGEACGLPAAVIRECLAELPPEDVDGGAL